MTGSSRRAVYWGAEPYPKGHEGFAPYVGWQQAHARDLGEADYRVLLAEARKWLGEDILKTATEGMIPDVRYRAALDLSLRTAEEGKYSVGLDPVTYNMLLARLAGVSGNETLLTIREASRNSLYHSPRERTTMRASARIRQYASKYASSHPEIAFDLLDMSSKVAEEEQEQSQSQQQKQAQDQDQQGQGQQSQQQKQAQQDQAQQDQGQQQKQAQQDQQDQAQQQKQAGELPPALKKYNEENGKGGDKEKDEKDQDQGQKQAAYAQLKASIIHTASTNPATKAALMPALRLIRQLG